MGEKPYELAVAYQEQEQSRQGILTQCEYKKAEADIQECITGEAPLEVHGNPVDCVRYNPSEENSQEVEITGIATVEMVESDDTSEAIVSYAITLPSNRSRRVAQIFGRAPQATVLYTLREPLPGEIDRIRSEFAEQSTSEQSAG